MKGVVGVYSEEDASRKGLYLLYGVQHRGQESAGLSAASNHSLRTWRGRGLVSNVFEKRFRSWIHPDDYLAIGCASGAGREDEAFPPLEVDGDGYQFSLAFDGLLPGGEENQLSSLLKEYLESVDVKEAVAKFMHEKENAFYSLVMAYHDEDEEESKLIVARDARGVRPLYLARNDKEVYIASESAAIEVLSNIGAEFTEKRDIPPGALIVKGRDGLKEEQILGARPAHCAFEWVYFGRPDSVIEGKNVHMVRKRLGHALVNTHRLSERYVNKGEDLTVIPVPDSGRSVCTGVSEALDATSDEGVIKNAYMGRTYIIDDPQFRKTASDLKHNIVKSVVKDRKVIITDDSIVRGTVSESVAKNLIRSGAKEVEFLVSYAPIIYPCFSDPKDKTLAAAPYSDKALEEIGDLVAKNLPSINKVLYNPPKNVVKSIGLPMENICTYCITGINPFDKIPDS